MLLLSRRLFAIFAGATLLAAALPASAEIFTVAVVPDTQNYADATLPQPRGEDTFVQQMRYLVDTRDEKNLAFVTFVGDIVQHGDGRFRQQIGTDATPRYRYWDTRAEWDIANRAISVLGHSGIPFGMSPGNHDYDNYSWWLDGNGPGAGRPLSGGRVWDLYFGPQSRYFAGRSWYGGAFNQGLNSYQFFTGAGRRFLHLSLEMQPTPAALEWAQGVIDAHPGLPIIVTTHEWLLPAATGRTERSNGYQSYFAGTDHLPPDEVWNRFIRRNAQIFLILSGHNWTPTVDGVSQGENLRVDRNDAGHPVYQMLQDYQGNTVGPDGTPGSANGGAGWLRFIAFDTERRKMHFYTYSPLLSRYAGRDGERTFGAEPRYSDFELDFPPQLLR
ncbi:calcineurin-like phosphoesterase family protein [Hephaestia caeni]|uniref:Calcineurin-like phosphoesterase family protein n=1 Tax=Hephaestia caeni TaxID=645617 RepID=A0A397PG75_9SPHN|nr:metallophosphoesterase [Hephaestia caeni]RIA46245.1 calcineurin-like phosphoesterase family protein [Hephaestia caeni]